MCTMIKNEGFSRTDRKRGDGGQQHDFRGATAVCLRRETPDAPTAKEHGLGSTRETYRALAGDAFEAGTRQAVSHPADLAANRHGIRSGAGTFLYRRT